MSTQKMPTLAMNGWLSRYYLCGTFKRQTMGRRNLKGIYRGCHCQKANVYLFISKIPDTGGHYIVPILASRVANSFFIYCKHYRNNYRH